MVRKILFPVLLIVVLMVGITGVAYAAPPKGVDHLRGRWDGVVEDLLDGNQPFVLMLDEFHPDPNDSSATLYNGCLAVGAGARYAPVSARFVSLGGGNYDMTLFGTAMGSVIKLEGVASTNDATVTDDPASGEWQTADQAGNWSAYHHDRREPQCPAVQLGGELQFHGDVYGIIGIAPEGEQGSQGAILESFTNIVSSAVRVDLPDGGSVELPFFTDLFSPSVDFLSQFRFIGDLPNLPVTDGQYAFTLLDVFGQPISGATFTDIWLACPQDAPRDVSAALDAGGISLSWSPVSPVAGFDPSGMTPLGFYQIELGSLTGGGGYGAGGMHTNTHLIPYAGFNGFAPGFPDGEDYGNGLFELSDGSYRIETIAFAEAVHPGGFGLECQVRAWEEQITFEKLGGTITLLP